MSRPITINELDSKAMICEILEHEKEINELTWEECCIRGEELETLSRNELTARYLEVLLS